MSKLAYVFDAVAHFWSLDTHSPDEIRPSAEVQPLAQPRSSFLLDYLELSKSRIVLMVLITTAAGFFYASPHGSIALLVHALIGTALVAAGTNAISTPRCGARRGARFRPAASRRALRSCFPARSPSSAPPTSPSR